MALLLGNKRKLMETARQAAIAEDPLRVEVGEFPTSPRPRQQTDYATFVMMADQDAGTAPSPSSPITVEWDAREWDFPREYATVKDAAVMPFTAATNELPNWLSFVTADFAFKCEAEADWEISGAIDWKTTGSVKEEAVIFLSLFRNSGNSEDSSYHEPSTPYANERHRVIRCFEDVGTPATLVHPPRILHFRKGDKVRMRFARVSGDAGSGWTITENSWLTIKRLGNNGEVMRRESKRSDAD